MDLYTFCVVVGFGGFALMALSGLGARHSGAHTHAGAHHGAHHGGHHGTIAAARAGARARHGGRGARAPGISGFASRWLAPLISPRFFFTLLFGFGATGLVARHWLAGAPLAATAVLGAIAFERLVVSPVWNALMRFGSEPAMTLESGLLDEARAVTAFDADGRGLISLELDGQIVQVLGILVPAERAAGVRVRAGDRLVVQEVDGARNRCLVSASRS